jgi:hypothetical protein
MPLIDTTHPFYRSKGRRIAVVATTAMWTAFEVLFAKDPFWSVLAAGACALTAWVLLIDYKEPPPPSASAKSGD